jgi:hypothetical protein
VAGCDRRYVPVVALRKQGCVAQLLGRDEAVPGWQRGSPAGPAHVRQEPLPNVPVFPHQAVSLESATTLSG